MFFPPLLLNLSQSINTESRLSVPACCTDVLSLVSLPGAVQRGVLIRDALSGALQAASELGEGGMLRAH